MAFLDALGDFAGKVTENFSAQVAAQPEDQLKAPVMSLLEALGRETGKKIVSRTEASPESAQGRPDIGVTVDSLLAGFIELKQPGLGSNPARLRGDQNRKQWENFKSIPNLIYTDGNEWTLYRTGERTGATVRLDGDITTDDRKAASDETARALETLLLDFLGWDPIVPHNARALAHFLAPLAKLVRNEAELAVSRKGSALSVLAHEWRSYLFPNIDDHQFADAYAQTLTYSLLLARISGADDLSPEAAAKVLDDGNGLLATTLRILAHPEARKEVGTGYDLLERSLSALDPHDVLKRNPDLWLYFYEDFLSVYDSKLRRDYGVYYTPVEVVQCQVRLISELLDERFGKRLSFADDGVTFIDPAVGTGTYLVTATQHALEQVRDRSGEGSVPARASLLARNMYAFEFLVGPYAVSHLRLTQEITSEKGQLPDGRLQIYLADTLESPFTTPPGALDLTHKPLVEERKRARVVKEQQNILVCLGNPPYDRQQIDPEDEITQRKGGWVRFGDEGQERPIFEDFVAPTREAGQAVHLKNVYNDYVYFWRWALWKLFEHQDSGGVVSFITASSYLAGPGFIGMREAMRRTFDDLWIINLEGDSLGARKTENVFSIRTPVAIAIGVCDGPPKRDVPARTRYVKLSGTRKEKLEHLKQITSFEQLDWLDCLTGWQDRFLPQGQGDFFAWPAVTDVFPWQQSGAQFKRRWPIGETREVLEARWQEFLSLDSGRRKTAFVETRDRKVSRSYSNTLPGAGQSKPGDLTPGTDTPNIARYGFRSFDRQWAFFDTRFGDYLRPDLFGTMSERQVFLTSLLTEQIGHGPSAVVSAALPDLHHFSGRGAKDVIPLWRDASCTEPNIAAGLLERLRAAYGHPVSAEDLFAYAYAVLASPVYVETFWEELSTPGPRLPISRDPALFSDMAEMGRRLIWLHTYGERMVPAGKRPGDVPQGAARCLAPVPETEADYPDEVSYDPAAKEIRVGKGRFGPVEAEVWEFEVSGLKVVQSWLAYRRRSGYGRRSSPLDEIRPVSWTAQMTDELLELLWVLEHTVALYPELREKLEGVVSGECFSATELPTPAAEERRPPRGAASDASEDEQAPELDFGVPEAD